MGPLPDFGPSLVVLAALAVIGVVALIGGGVWLVWYLATHLTVGWV